MYYLIPDWQKARSLTLVYPKNLQSEIDRVSREELLNFYHYFLSILNKNNPGLSINLILQSSDWNDEGLKEHIQKIHNNLDFLFLEIKCQDIWVRDWAPIPIKIQMGPVYKNSLIKSIYYPDYCPSRQITDNEAGKILQVSLKNTLLTFPFKWDIGNLTTNGRILIVTDKL